MGEKYDIAFLGGGPAGYQGAIRAAQLGARVAVVEEKFVGGVCLNWGCIPTKAVRASAEVGRSMRRAREYGFKPVETIPDIAAIIGRKQRVVKSLRRSIEQLFRARKIELFEGRGALTGPGKIEVQKDGQADLVEARKVVIATGSRPAGLPIFPNSPRIFLADEMLDISYLPAHLLVVGGGAVGVEMAAIFRELGSEVTLVEALHHILPHDDREMTDSLLSTLQRREIKISCGTSVESVADSGDGFNVRLSNGTEITPDTILQAIGRRLNTAGIGLEELGIEMEQGRILVDKHLQTNVAGHYAAGDVVGDWLLAHVAFAEGICAAEHALGRQSWMDYWVVPRCVFTIPEYAAVGISEEEARKEYSVKVSRFPFKSLGIAQAIGESEGQVKIIADIETDTILGAHIVGPHGADLIAEIALAMRSDLPVRAIMDTIHTHPTLSEAVLEVAQALHGQAIHSATSGHAPHQRNNSRMA
ncbi:MAG: dihydrolipoyl dehydrogenase [Desulforhabdus sp.]|jgi:dihydrolipoamide dehydrogenase|nr:dihydrolipoyl dehydrogenase [Desulforhabdus sp.]